MNFVKLHEIQSNFNKACQNMLKFFKVGSKAGNFEKLRVIRLKFPKWYEIKQTFCVIIEIETKNLLNFGNFLNLRKIEPSFEVLKWNWSQILHNCLKIGLFLQNM